MGFYGQFMWQGDCMFETLGTFVIFLHKNRLIDEQFWLLEHFISMNFTGHIILNGEYCNYPLNFVSFPRYI